MKNKTLLYWPGNKKDFQSLNNIVRNAIIDNCIFVEPFAGSLSLSINMKLSGASISKFIANDINKFLINFFQQVQLGLNAKDFDFILDEKQYYIYREEFNSTELNEQSSKRMAFLFFYLNRTGFNGNCRFNSRGGYNVPFNHNRKQETYDVDFEFYKKIFSNFEFHSGDFEQLSIPDNAVIYADSPYDKLSESSFTKYSKEDFDFDDQIRLAHWLYKFNFPIIASNHWTEKIVSLYGDLGFQMFETVVKRMISSNKNGLQEAKEVIFLKNVRI